MKNNKPSLVIASIFLNHYQLAISKELMKHFSDFRFVVSDPLPQERLSLGFADMNNNDFVVRAYEDKELARKTILDADIVITGSYKFEGHINERLKQNKLVIFNSERLFKYNPILNVASALINMYRYRNAHNCYLLAISAYAVNDYNRIGLFKDKTYKWGYFSESIKYDDVDQLIKNKKHNSIVWAGRLIEWKHPEYCIEIAGRLKEEGYDFSLNIIGNGKMQEQLEKMVIDNHLENTVQLLGSMSPEKVREKMEESELYLFTSDKGEGWGVVLTEALNSCCACVASYSTGSTPFIVNGSNGLVYKNDSVDELYKNVKYLLDNENAKYEICKNAYNSIINMWNPETAANRFCEFSSKLLNDEDVSNLYDKDILSKAEPIE